MSKKQTLESLLASDSFIRWIKGRALEEEREYWINWLHQNPDHRYLVEQAEELMQVTSPDELIAPDAKTELRKFEASLDNLKSDSKDFSRATTSRARRRSRVIWGRVAAACVVLAVSVTFYLTFEGNLNDNAEETSVVSKQHEFRTGFGEKISLKLSDGSNIVLNANSHLQYSSSVKEGQNIDVWLEGEAYFDIAHLKDDERRFFRVHTSDGVVEVLGTTFTVRTTSDGTQTVLKEGKIRVQVNDTEPDSDLIMKPGQLAYFISGSDQIERRAVDPLIYTSWTQNIWTFRETSLTEIAERMERTFGVKVRVSSDTLREKVFSGSIKSTNLGILKEGLSKLLHEPVIQNGNMIVIGLED